MVAEIEELDSTAIELENPKRQLRLEVTMRKGTKGRGLKVECLTEKGWTQLLEAEPGKVKIEGKPL